VIGQLGLWVGASPEAIEAVAVEPVKKTPKPLRYYQRDCVEAVRTSLFVGSEGAEPNRSCLIVKATGLGKTRVFSEIAKLVVEWLCATSAKDARVLVIAHRDELITQAMAALREATGELVGKEKADFRSGDERIIVTSTQTMHRRCESFPKDYFSLLILDEAHRAPTPSNLKIFKHFETAKILGVTATPDRADEKPLGQVFDDVAFVMDIEDGINAGYLVPVEGVEVALDEIDISKVATSGDDLNQEQLDDAMLQAVEGIVTKTHELVGDEQAIVFTPGVKSAHAMSERMNLLAPGKAIAIDGETDKDLRVALVAGFKAGRYRYLFNCDVATEGFDAPATSVVVMAAPTKSRGKYAQRAGRGTRPLPGIVDHLDGAEAAADRCFEIAMSAKPRMRIIDFVGNAGTHSLVSPADILGANYTEEEVHEAKKALKSKPDGDIQTALKDARAALKRAAAALQAAKVKVNARVGSFDPFKTLGMDRETSIDIRFDRRPISDWQAERLVKKGLDAEVVAALDFRSAKRLLDKAKQRQEAGLATLKQLGLLNKYMPVGDTTTFSAAQSAIDYIKGECNWKARLINADRLSSLLKGA
jgi:superfamily II DNA or RNA helicase